MPHFSHSFSLIFDCRWWFGWCKKKKNNGYYNRKYVAKKKRTKTWVMLSLFRMDFFCTHFWSKCQLNCVQAFHLHPHGPHSHWHSSAWQLGTTVSICVCPSCPPTAVCHKKLDVDVDVHAVVKVRTCFSTNEERLFKADRVDWNVWRTFITNR